MATSGDWLPRTREGRIAMSRKWLEVLNARGAEWGISDEEVERLRALFMEANMANIKAQNSAGDRELIALANEASGALAALMRVLHRRLLSFSLEASDWISLELEPRDHIRTDHTEVRELVKATLRPGAIREVIVEFQVEGADHRAKPTGYDGAVIIWGIGNEALTRIEDLSGGHVMASRTPHTLVFTDDERGKTVSIALCWQNERGIRGEWSAILSTVIP